MVNNSTNINKTKESLNSDGQLFHQYQQKEQRHSASNYWTQKFTKNGFEKAGPRFESIIANIKCLQKNYLHLNLGLFSCPLQEFCEKKNPHTVLGTGTKYDGVIPVKGTPNPSPFPLL